MGLLGYGSITLTDLTEALPISLNLSSSLATNIQVKEGEKCIPDFTKEGVIITPSVFLGGEEVDASKYADKINYSVNGITTEPNEKDKNGNLVCYKIASNLTENISIGANISNFTSDEGITYTAVYALNPITLMLLEKDGGFSAFIESTRDFFDEDNSGDIVLTAKLYAGADEQTEGVSYVWLDSQGNSQGTEQTLTVKRDEVSSIETFICEMTNQYGTKFRVSKNIYDRTDSYFGSIISNGSTILTPQHTKITLTNQIWHKTSIINGDASSAVFSYDWYCLDEKGNFKDQEHGTQKTFEIDLAHTHDGKLVFPKSSFNVYCETKIRNKVVVVSSLAIQYSPTNYSVSIEPIAFFVPASSTGAYKGEGKFSKTIRFQLLDDNKQPLDFNETSDEVSSIADFAPFTSCSILSAQDGKWDFNITLEYDKEQDAGNNFTKMDASKTFTINYKYLGVAFDASFECIKSVQGDDGAVGASGYTLSLSNEFWMLAGGESKANEGQTTETTIEAREGAENLTITEIEIESKNIKKSFPQDNNTLIVDNIEIEKSATNDKLTFKTGKGIEKGGIFVIYVSFNNLKGDSITMAKTFKYEINYKGDSYELLCSPTSLIYTPATKSFNNDNITLSPVCYVGGKGDPTVMSSYTISAQVDGGTEQKLTSLSYKDFTKNNISITFRLYRGTAIDSTKLVDIITVPIIVSQEGVVIGGENLIPWSKRMPEETNKWQRVGNGSSQGLEIEDSYGFSVIHINVSDKEIAKDFPWCSYESPKIDIMPEYLGNQFTLSGYFYSDDWSKISKSTSANSEHEADFYVELVFEKEGTYLYQKILAVRSETDYTGTYDDGNTLPTGKWFKFYQTFTLREGLDTDYKMRVKGNMSFAGDVRFKQLKLEKGNVATAWSPADGDTSYEDISGTNLCQNLNLHIQVKGSDPYICLNNSLEKNTQYTFSIMDASIEEPVEKQNQFLWQIVEIQTSETGDGTKVEINNPVNYYFSNNSAITQTQTFTTPNNNSVYGLVVYARGDSEKGAETTILTISYVKIEKGEIATPFIATEDYLSNLYKELNKNTDEKIQVVEVALAETGERITAQLDGTKDSIENLQNSFASSYITKDELDTKISMVKNDLIPVELDNYLQQIQSSITFSTEGTSPYIQLKMAAGEKSFATKITDSQIGFYQNNATEPVAYLSSNTLQVNYAHFKKSFNIGDLIVSITDSGVGFNW